MRTVGAVAYMLALAVWVGGGVVYTFVLTPAIFATYPRNSASEIVGTMMPHYFATLLVAAVVAALLLPLLWRSWSPRARALVLALLVGALAAQSWVRWRLYPEILEVKSRVPSFESAPDAPERQRFRSLHGLSMALNLAVLADGVVLLALVSFARRRDD